MVGGSANILGSQQFITEWSMVEQEKINSVKSTVLSGPSTGGAASVIYGGNSLVDHWRLTNSVPTTELRQSLPGDGGARGGPSGETSREGKLGQRMSSRHTTVRLTGTVQTEILS